MGRKRRKLTEALDDDQTSSEESSQEEEEEVEEVFDEKDAGFTEDELAICTRVLDKLDKRRHYLSMSLFSELTMCGKRLFCPISNEEKRRRRKARRQQRRLDKKKRDDLKRDRTLLKRKKDAEKEMIRDQLNSVPSLSLLQLLDQEQQEQQQQHEDDKNIPPPPLHEKYQKIMPKNSSVDMMMTDEVVSSDNELGLRVKCHICRKSYRELHFFYHSLCPTCATFNYEKRVQQIDFTGRVALVTGGRIKIGYEISLLLLRNNCSVIVTSRFPKDAAIRFSKEQDFPSFKQRLKIYGLDFKHVPSVIQFAQFINDNYPRLDILINNAAQTIRRPPSFYEEVARRELTQFYSQLSSDLQHVIAIDWVMPLSSILSSFHHSSSNEQQQQQQQQQQQLVGTDELVLLNEKRSNDVIVGVSGLLSQQESMLVEEVYLPKGVYDLNNEQVDTRKLNTWILNLNQVPVIEYLEVQTINATAPFLLCKYLRPLMARTPSTDKYIINVSSMEGQFYRLGKKTAHPHTNMAKAALNMLTRTCGADFAKDRIWMNSVDTGWVTDENPQSWNSKFTCPLDEVDGAMRVLDPIFESIRTGTNTHSQFFKDYKRSLW